MNRRDSIQGLKDDMGRFKRLAEGEGRYLLGNGGITDLEGGRKL